MPPSAATDETRAEAPRAGAQVVAMPGVVAHVPAPHHHDAHGHAHDTHAHVHEGRAHDAHAHEPHSSGSHDHAPGGAARPAVRLGPSVLRLSLGGRLVIAGVLIAALWAVVLLVTGGQA